MKKYNGSFDDLKKLGYIPNHFNQYYFKSLYDYKKDGRVAVFIDTTTKEISTTAASTSIELKLKKKLLKELESVMTNGSN